MKLINNKIRLLISRYKEKLFVFLILNHLYLHLIMIILYTIMLIYSADTYLCDSGDIKGNWETDDKLVTRLEAEADAEYEASVGAKLDKLWDEYDRETVKYQDLAGKFTNYVDLTKKTVKLREAKEEIPDVIRDMKVVSISAYNDMKDSLAKVRGLEKEISELCPDFKPSFLK